MSKFSFDKITTHLITSGFVYPGSEIYGGLANSWDYGPLGTLAKNHLKEEWRKHFVRENHMIYEIEPAIIMNPKVWEATGHVANFHDPLVDCKYCHTRYRADTLIKDQKPYLNVDAMTIEDLNKEIESGDITCPSCGKSTFTPIRQFQMMFKTYIGVTEEKSSVCYLRPETAQGIFVNFKSVQRTTRAKLPFGVCDIGKAFRNEITPGNFTFRTREFEQMEIEFFFKPGEDMKWFEYWKDECRKFIDRIGIEDSHLRFRDHEPEELAFYSKGTTDIEYLFPFGWGELWGIADRTDYDLNKHAEHSGTDMTYMDPTTNEKYVPYVIEPSLGADRVTLAFLIDAYDEEELEGGDVRTVLHLHPALAPYKAAVLPLSKKLSEKADEVYSLLAKNFNIEYDETGSIGKRYRRQDEIGTPFCITVDFETENDGCVTIRHRDSMTQERVKIEELNDFIAKSLEF